MDLSALQPLLLLLCLCGLSVTQDVLPEGPLDALAGGTATFKTLLKNPEFAVFIWNFNDGENVHPISTLTPELQKVDDKYKGRANIDANGTLTLSGLKDDDSGEYSISFLDKSYTQRAAEIELRVMVPVSDVVITSNVPEASELAQVALTCKAKGSFLRFKWMNGTTPIVADGKRLKIERVESSSVLSFSSVYRSDLVGPIVCEAFNTLSNGKSVPFNLTVHYGPEQVIISPNPPSFLPSQSDMGLTCSAISSPKATFAWYHGDTALKTTGPIITVKDIEKEGLGKTKTSYTCNATNAKTGKSVASPPVTFTIIEKIEGLKLSAPSGKLFAGNSSANLSCEATKGSMQTVKWLKNGAPLSSGGRVVIATDKKSVLIEPLQKDDNGEFTCEISNPVSTETKKVKLMVYYGPEPVTLTGDIAVEVTEEVKLECSSASVPPATFTWKFNGTVTAVTTSEYVIDKAVYSNTGTYTCEAHNAVTGKSESKSHFLSVKEEGALDPVGLSDGAIAGIVIGVLAAVALAIGLFLYCRQKVPVESPY